MTDEVVLTTSEPWTVTFELENVNRRALELMFGGRRRFRRAREAALRARLGPPAPVLRNRRRGWRRGR